jgi:hypothetical protein
MATSQVVVQRDLVRFQQPLAANSTYDVVVPAGGIKDLAGNAIQQGAVAHFSTGTTLDAVVACQGTARS